MGKLIMFIMKVFGKTIILMVCIGLVFVVYKANQPMTVPDAPQGMTYVEFIKDRIDAAKTVEPSRCGWGMMFSLATLGPIYSLCIQRLRLIQIVPWPWVLLPIRISRRVLKVRSGTKSREFGGVWWSNYPGQCLESRSARDVSFEK